MGTDLSYASIQIISCHSSSLFKSSVKRLSLYIFDFLATLKEETLASGKIREIFGINFRELAVFAFLARINFREFMI